jgi:hypothetical protein
MGRNPLSTRLPRTRFTPKQNVRLLVPRATLDYVEYFRNHAPEKPCWFIREGLQGAYLHKGLHVTPRAAWKAASEQLTTLFIAHNRKQRRTV